MPRHRLEALLHVAVAREAVERQDRRRGTGGTRPAAASRSRASSAPGRRARRRARAGRGSRSRRRSPRRCGGATARCRASARPARCRWRRGRARRTSSSSAARSGGTSRTGAASSGPRRRVERVLRHLDHAHERLPRLHLALEDVRQQREQQDRHAGDGGEAEQRPAATAVACRCDGMSRLHPASSPPPVTGAGVAVQAVELVLEPGRGRSRRRARGSRGSARSSPGRARDRRGVISIGSLKFWSVNAAECRKPWSALAIHLASPACGRWHSTHVAVWRCPLFSQASYCSFMTWQLMHARGSVERYEKPFA